nr:FAD-binding oxidoreductase [Ardenticatena sp.]
MRKRYESWGKYPKHQPASVYRLRWHTETPPFDRFDRPVLAYGLGRSYGDVCLNENGILLDTARMAHFIAFDEERGVLRCEAGVSLKHILDLIVPRGWFLPVTPGTKYVTVGGAIANDVHGKNHHREGTFGRHVTQFELLRSTGERLLCSPTQNSDLFRATIGGLGLTGLITWAEIKLRPIKSAYIDMERIRFGSLDEFFDISARSDTRFEHTVAWLDCIAQGSALGRGVFLRGNHSEEPGPLRPSKAPRLYVPFDFPSFVLNPLSMRAFNTFYYYMHTPTRSQKRVHYESFFYPLDAVRRWNRIYGRRGFIQYQCVVPPDDRVEVMRELLTLIARSGRASFLAVFKEFGEVASPGMLSFPRKGVTLALDFPFEGEATLRLCEQMDAIVREAGGVLYPAKDARMSGEDFRRFYPQWETFRRYVDPAFSSSFWRRVMGETPANRTNGA